MMKKLKGFFLRSIILLSAILILVGCDQTTKKVARAELKNKPGVEVAGVVNFHYVENEDGMLGLGNKLSPQIKVIIFIVIVSVFLILLLLHLLLRRDESFSQRFALLLILCGGIGNLIDRIFNNGSVVDFIRLKPPLLNNAVFNVADFYVTTGFVFLILSAFIRERPETQIKS